MAASELKRRVRIERRERRQDELGQPVDQWVEVVTTWASVGSLTGKELLRSNAVVGSAATSIRIRYRKDIRSGMRIVVDGWVYHIVQPLPHVNSRAFMDLACRASFGDD